MELILFFVKIMRADLEGEIVKPRSNKKADRAPADLSSDNREESMSEERLYKAMSSANWIIRQPPSKEDSHFDK